MCERLTITRTVLLTSPVMTMRGNCKSFRRSKVIYLSFLSVRVAGFEKCKLQRITILMIMENKNIKMYCQKIWFIKSWNASRVNLQMKNMHWKLASLSTTFLLHYTPLITLLCKTYIEFTRQTKKDLLRQYPWTSFHPLTLSDCCLSSQIMAY